MLVWEMRHLSSRWKNPSILSRVRTTYNFSIEQRQRQRQNSPSETSQPRYNRYTDTYKDMRSPLLDISSRRSAG